MPLELNPALMAFKGLRNSIAFRGNSVRANIENK